MVELRYSCVFLVQKSGLRGEETTTTQPGVGDTAILLRLLGQFMQ